jgi:PAS domain S-box-containing protein
MNTWNISLAMETECYQEFRYLLEDAQTRWVLAQSAPMFKPYVGTVGYIGTITDITVRKLAEIKYLQSELKFSQLLKIIPLSVMVCDVLSEISFINDRFEQLFGYSTEDITTINDWWLQAFPDENYRDLIIGNVKKAIDRAVIEKTDIEAAEYTVVCKNGMQRIILFSGIVFDDSVIFVGVDVSERKKMELELQRSNAELEQFAYAVSHDMRQPLRMVSSFLPLIEDALAGQLNEETRQYLDFAVEGAKRMDAMIVSLLEYSRAGRTITANALISSRVVLDEVLAFLKPEIEATAASIEISGEWPNLTVNCDQLTRVFQNLIGNALKYHEENTPPQIKVVAHTDTRMFHFFVRDSGVGIDASQIPKLFKVFSRLHARTRFEGTGVGLALCRRIVENMGGSIGVESEGEGKGCTFWFELPL